MAKPLPPVITQIIDTLVKQSGHDVVVTSMALAQFPGLSPTDPVPSTYHSVRANANRLLHKWQSNHNQPFNPRWRDAFIRVATTSPNQMATMLRSLVARKSLDVLSGRLTLLATREGIRSSDLAQECRGILFTIDVTKWTEKWKMALIHLIIETWDPQEATPAANCPPPVPAAPAKKRYLVKFDDHGMPAEATEVSDTCEREALVIRYFADGTSAVRILATSLLDAINEAAIQVKSPII